MSLGCSQCAQSVPLNSTRKSNKNEYDQYNFCLRTLLLNIHHDAVSGWLLIVSLFYNTQQYNKTIYIIMYCLAKYTHKKLYRFMDMSNSHFRLLSLQLFEKTSMVQLWKILLMDEIKFSHNSYLIPKELQMEVKKGEYTISSTVYAYFLKLLCHYHLNDVRQCQDCLYTLQLVLAENGLIGVKANTVLGIAIQLLGYH